jgi:hypothetical protein
MRNRQVVCLIGKHGKMSKIPAADFFALQRAQPHRFYLKRSLPALFLNLADASFAIHLESAVFVFHINSTTQGITGSLRAACSEPVQRFLACPFS